MTVRVLLTQIIPLARYPRLNKTMVACRIDGGLPRSYQKLVNCCVEYPFLSEFWYACHDMLMDVGRPYTHGIAKC